MSRALRRIQLLVLLLPFMAMGAVFAYGTTLPRGHLEARAVRIAKPPAEVFVLLADVAGWARWSARVREVTMLPADEEGRPRWRIDFGERRATYVTLLVEKPPERLTLALVDPAGPYRGEWRFSVRWTAGGSRVDLLELARFGNPFARFLVHLSTGKTRQAEEQLRELACALGETSPVIERITPESLMETITESGP